MEKNDNNITIYSGIAFNDPTGDIKRIRSLINSLLNLVDDMCNVWDEATKVDNFTIRQHTMQRLNESIDSMMNLVHAMDRELIIDLGQKEA